ncbi:MAG: GlsB/YeaQ/YmgE family stress response membrane protein [Candidatus Saccharimonas sp.]
MWDIVAWLIIGGLAGWIASKIMKTDKDMGIVANIIVGVVGALVGGWLSRVLFGIQVDPNGFSIGSVLVAIIGSVLLLAMIKFVKR